MAKGISSTLMIMVLVIIVLLILLFTYYAKGTGLFSKLADLVLSQESRFLPAQPREELKQNEKLPQIVIDAQQNFVNLLKNSLGQSSESNICRVQLQPFSGMGDLGMKLSNFGNNINSKIIKIKSAEGELALNTKTVENANICLINQNFYNCYIDASRNCEGKLYDDVIDVKITRDSAYTDNGNYEISTMLKIDNNKFCFIPARSGFLAGANREIPECGSKPEAAISDKDKIASQEFNRFVAFLQDLSSNAYDKVCTKKFFFDTNKIGTKYYIYANPNDQNQETYKLKINEQNGRIIQPAKVDFIPHGDFSSDSTFNSYPQDTYIISPAGDYSTIDKATVTIQVTAVTAISRDNKWILTIPDRYTSNLPPCA